MQCSFILQQEQVNLSIQVGTVCHVSIEFKLMLWQLHGTHRLSCLTVVTDELHCQICECIYVCMYVYCNYKFYIKCFVFGGGRCRCSVCVCVCVHVRACVCTYMDACVTDTNVLMADILENMCGNFHMLQILYNQKFALKLIN
jgi:hypothetical protein